MGRNEEAVEILNRISEINNNNKRISDLPGTLKHHEEDTHTESHGNALYLFNVAYRGTTFLVMTITFCTIGIYYGIVYFQEDYLDDYSSGERSVFWENLVCTSAEFPAVFIIFFIFDRVPRRALLAVLYFIAFVAFLGIIFGNTGVGIALIFIGRMVISSAYSGIIVYILEFYPTPVRVTSLGVCIISGQIAALVTTYLAEEPNKTITCTVYCVLSLIATIATILLTVETKDRMLVDDIIDNTISYNDDESYKNVDDIKLETKPLLSSTEH